MWPAKLPETALLTLQLASQVEYRFISYYSELEKLMPDDEVRRRVKILREASVTHREITSQAVSALGGEVAVPPLQPLPKPLDLMAFFRRQLEYEKLASWLYDRMEGLVSAEFAPRFRQMASEEKDHIRLTEEIISRLEQTSH